MTKLPSEFEDLLTRHGRRLLGATSRAGGQVAVLRGLVDPRKAAACCRLLDRRLLRALGPLSDPIPDWTVSAMRKNGEEMLPKVMRCRTAMLGRTDSRVYAIAERIGLVALLRSQSFAAFARALAGRALSPRWGIQALCYQVGDYVGPHNDHFPEEAAARGGYFDVHVTLTTASVAHQWLVYAEHGHLSRIESVGEPGVVAAYRLPLWHFTTPLVAKPGRERTARRWVLIGTFLFADSHSQPGA